MPEIDVEHCVDVALDHRVIAQQISDGAIAIAGLALGEKTCSSTPSSRPAKRPKR